MLSAPSDSDREGVLQVRLKHGTPGSREPFLLLVAALDGHRDLATYSVEYSDADADPVRVYTWDTKTETVEQTERSVSGDAYTLLPLGVATGLDPEAIRQIASGERAVPAFEPE